MTGAWFYPWVDVTSHKFESSNQEWIRALSDLVLKKATLSFEGCEKQTFRKKKN